MTQLASFLCGVLLLASAGMTWAQSSAPVLLNGAGATFPYPVYSKWFDEYHKLHPNIQINYQSIGSGGGIRQVTEGTVDFGASDAPMTDQQLQEFKTKRGFAILHFPAVLGADVPIYNIPGVTQELKFTPEALAGIFLGKITKWNDPALAKANPGVPLPGNGILVIHRADGSGTTYIWTDYLAKVSAEWKQKVGVGTAVNWPVGLGGKGNEGVSGLVKQTPYSMGYVELVYALQSKINYGSVQNAAGSFVKSALASVTAAAAGTAKTMPADFRVSITNAAGANSYPIASYTWLLIPSKIADARKKEALLGFLQWMVREGQKYAETLGYASLPQEVIEMERKAFSQIQ